MKDIAEDLGLSIVTISKVLRNHPDISDETRERVLRRVKELRYRPNVNARSLVTGYSYLIGLVVPDLLHPFFAEIAKAMARSLRRRGYSLIIASSDEDAEIEQSEIEHMLSRQIDGIVIAACTGSEKTIQRFTEQQQPILLLDRELDGFKGNFVGTDDLAAGLLATSHLLSLGRQRVAHICGRMNSTGVRRAEGYREALQRAGVPIREQYIVSRERVDTESEYEGREAMRQLLALAQRPDAVFCYNDPMAIGTLMALGDAGLRVPEDVALIGCGNLHYDAALRVPLSSIDQQSSAIGERAAELILDLVEGVEDGQPRSVLLEPQLVVRASTVGLAAPAAPAPRAQRTVVPAASPARARKGSTGVLNQK